ncbi:hypothetical protein HPB48_014969 [Haemaphysalis longicornis]|uniref:Uncharacterized protein n=1 Tax=Haemaphysalis longicornis TaxID=44386 RepID=A0A9J6F7G1_HAELO|nr:hypothetical protein HPB48_014969 [Haemaphysalis longicornis]
MFLFRRGSCNSPPILTCLSLSFQFLLFPLGVVKWRQYQLSTQQFEVCFRRLQSIPFPANNIVSLHLHEFLSSCALKLGIAEDTLLLCLVTSTSHLMGLSSTKIHLTPVWQENPVLWSAVLVPQMYSCHNFVWTLQKLLFDLHSELTAKNTGARPVVVDEASRVSLTKLLETPKGGSVIAAHSSFEHVKTVFSAVGRSKFEKLALGVPVLWCSHISGAPVLSEVRFNLCCVTDPNAFHSFVAAKEYDSAEFQECMWPNVLLVCAHEKSPDLATTHEEVEDVELDRLKSLLLSIAEAHCLPIQYKLSQEARSVLPQLISKFKQLSLSWNCKLALFKTATSQIFRLAAALYVLDGCLSSGINADVTECEIPAAYIWEAHDIVMHSLRIKAELLECPLRDDLFHCPENPGASRQNNNFGHHANGTVSNITVSSVFCLAPEVQGDHEQVPVAVPIPRELSVSLVQPSPRENEHSGAFHPLPEPQESYFSLSSVIPDSDQEFVDKFHYKIRRLLISGKSLLTPTLVAQMKYVSVTDPNVPGKPRYPTQVASLFLERVAGLGFGTMLTRHDSHSKKLLFRKTDYQQLGPAQLKLLQSLRVTREQYSHGCPRPRPTPYWEAGSGVPIHTPLAQADPAPSLPVKQEVIDLH